MLHHMPMAKAMPIAPKITYTNSHANSFSRYVPTDKARPYPAYTPSGPVRSRVRVRVGVRVAVRVRVGVRVRMRA